MSIIGYIGGFEECQKKIYLEIENNFKKNKDILEIDSSCKIEDVKKFRNFINTNGINKKIGIIYYLNCFNQEEQAMLLKIFEELPDFSCIYFAATGSVSFALQTRSKVFYINSFNKDFKNIMEKYKKSLSEKNKKNKNVYEFFFKTYSLYENNYLKLEEKNNIVKVLGIE